jgi:hypothetical protein
MLNLLLIAILSIQGMIAPLAAAENDAAKDMVLQRLEQLSDAINQDRADATFWSDDAEFINPVTGDTIEGKDKIVDYIKGRIKEIKERDLKFAFTPNKTTFTNPDEAVVDGVVEITEKGALLQRNAREVVLVKQDGKWVIDSVSEIEVPPPPPVYLHLKEIAWLVGNWEDTDEDVTITFDTRWDAYHNFIFQTFKMVTYGVEVLEGLQIIGWDPIENKIRSWVYDSDGGFGSGLWSKKDESWEANINYVLSDGQKGSATNVYTKIDDSSYSFSSMNRNVSGKAVPNIEPVTVRKEKK